MPAGREATPRSRGASLRLYLTFFAGWVAAAVLTLRGAYNGQTEARTRVLAWLFVVGTGVLVAALVDRDAAARRRTNDLLLDRQALIESLGIVTDPRLTQLPLYQLLDDLLGRARTVLRASSAAVYLLRGEPQILEQIATSGNDVGPDLVEVGDGAVGRAAAGRRGLVATESGVSVLAAPLVAEGQLLGALRLAAPGGTTFRDDDLRLLQVVADRAAVAIDARRHDREARRATLAAEGARQRLAMLADAGAVLARPFDRVEAMAEALGRSLVPSFADWFGFHRVDDDGRPLLVVWEAGPGVDVGPRGTGDWTDAVTRAIQEGAPVLAWGSSLAREEAYRTARALGLVSVLVAPIIVQNVALGAMSFGTADQRRGFRAGDVSTASDLAARVGVAIERVILGAETQASAIRAARHAVQLQRLTDAAFAINAALAAPNLVDVIAEQARRVLEADAASVEVTGPDHAHALAGKVPGNANRATASLTDFSGAVSGSVNVVRKGGAFTGEEEAILASLAQMASVAVANARLYATVQVSEDRMRALYDASPVGIVELAADATAIRWNRAAESLFGWPPADPPPARAPEVPPAAREVVAVVVGGGSPGAMDAVLGEGIDAREVELFAVPLREAGRLESVVVAAVDVTERNQVAEQLQHAHRMEGMARMAGGIAHDFNNVLMVINGYAELLLHRELDDDVRVDIEAMRAAANRAARFTRQLLTISRRQVVQPLLVDVGETVRSLEDVLAVMVGSNVTLDLVVDDPPPVMIDPAQFEQVVLNLSINAKDAMPEGGTLRLTATRTEVDGAPWVELVVADSGEGMDPVTAEHCFEPFFTTKDRTKGTGLGLSTAYGVITQAGGEIGVTTELGVGTIFTIRLPGAEVPATAPTVPSTVSPHQVTALRILVVDDEPDVRAIVADMLELDGHEVTVAADGPDALAQLDAAAPDVLLTDVVMPGMLGTELAERVLAQRPATKVILMSSHVDDTMAVDRRVDGAMFLAKPFSADALAETLQALLGGLPA